MTDGFSVDVQQLETLAKNWNATVKQIEAMPAKISSIESSVQAAAREREFAQEEGEEINLGAIQVEGSNFSNFTKILNMAASQLKTLISQLEQDAQLIQRCSVEYQIADDAAANGITNISSALSSNATGSTQITSLLNSLSGDSGTALTAAQGLITAQTAQTAVASTGSPTTGGGSTTTAGTGTGGSTGTGSTGSVTDTGPTGGASSTGSTGTTASSGTTATPSTTSGATTTAGTTAAGTTATGTGTGTTATGTTSSTGTTTSGTTGTTTTPTTTSGTGTGSSTGTGTSTGTTTSTGTKGAGSGKDSVTDTAGGDWKTTGHWDSGTHGATVGQGMKAKLPSYDKLSGDRQQIMKNMVARVDKKVGYSQSAQTNGYRDDSSGAVSAAWGLSKPGLDATQLMKSSVSRPVTKDDLQPGDALVSKDHAVLFGGWANSAHTEYYALENDPSQGTVAHVVPYPYWPEKGKTDAGGTYEAYSKNGVS